MVAPKGKYSIKYPKNLLVYMFAQLSRPIWTRVNNLGFHICAFSQPHEIKIHSFSVPLRLRGELEQQQNPKPKTILGIYPGETALAKSALLV